MSDDNEVFRICREIADIQQQVMTVGAVSLMHSRPLSLEKERLVEALAELSCSTDEARRARAFVLYKRTTFALSATQLLAHAVACDMLEPR